MEEQLCQCGSNELYSQCCGKYHRGTLPENALKLMRSRYTAYQRQMPEYIISTTHPENPYYLQDTEKWNSNILFFSKNTEFIGLEIINFTDGQKEAFVTFQAILKQNGKDASFIEKSRFEKVNGKWLYKDGVFL